MELALAQFPLVLFTTLAPMASGAFVGLAIAFLTTRFSQERLELIDRWTLLPLGILVVGVASALVFFISPQHGLLAFQGIGGPSLTFAVFMAALFAVVALVYWVVAMSGRLGYRARTVFACVVGVLALVYAGAIGAPYVASAVSSWSSPITIIGLVGYCLAGGVPLGVLVVALAGGMPEARRTRFAGMQIIAAFVGVAASIFAVASQMLSAQSAYAAFFPGEALPGSWLYLLLSIVGFVAMLACLRAVVMPSGRSSAAPLGRTAGAAAAVPQRDQAKAKPVGVRSAVALLVVGNAAVIVAIFVARLVFYALQV